jgi:hypothetical protein
VGQALAVTFYLCKLSLGGINPGLPCLVANVLTAAAVNYSMRATATRTLPL